MARKPKQTPVQTCADCVHEYACKGWTHGQELSPENASRCDAFETVRDSAAYLIGKLEANEGCFSTVEAKGLYGKYRIFRANGTPVKDRCFVLKPDKDPASVKALQTYAAATDDEQLRQDLYEWVGEPKPMPEPPKEEAPMTDPKTLSEVFVSIFDQMAEHIAKNDTSKEERTPLGKCKECHWWMAVHSNPILEGKRFCLNPFGVFYAQEQDGESHCGDFAKEE